MDAAKNAKDSTIADATEQYESIYDTASTKLGDLSRYIDENTGEIKSIWQVFWDDVGLKWNNFWGSIENGWQDFKKSFKSGWNEFWTTGLGGAVVGGINGIISTVETGLNWIIEKINSLSFTTPDWLPFGLGGKRFGLDIPKITLGRVSMPTFAFGGFPEHGEMFIAREQGPELVGRIGNRTAGSKQRPDCGGRCRWCDIRQQWSHQCYLCYGSANHSCNRREWAEMSM